VWITRFCKAALTIPNTICGVPTRENGALPEASLYFGVFVAEGFISHLLKNSEHGPVIHVVPVDHGILTGIPCGPSRFAD